MTMSEPTPLNNPAPTGKPGSVVFAAYDAVGNRSFAAERIYNDNPTIEDLEDDLRRVMNALEHKYNVKDGAYFLTDVEKDRDDAWRRALLVALPVNQYAAAIAVFDRLRPDFRNLDEKLRNQIVAEEGKRTAHLKVDLDHEPILKLSPVDEADLNPSQ
jgi:hypothetical protein